MHISLLMGTSSVAQFTTVLLIFVFVLAITFFTTKWIAGFQKEQSLGKNITVVETVRIAQNKYIQIVKIGDSYFAYAVCKDTITLISQIDKESLDLEVETKESFNFKEFLAKARENEKDN